jgi:hypothetical protein
VLVLDDFGLAPTDTPPEPTPNRSLNCVYTGQSARNEVGSGGATGTSLPPGQTHGDAVFQVLGQALDRVATAAPDAPSISFPSVSPDHVRQWRSTDATILAVGVDVAGYDTTRIVDELPRVMSAVTTATGGRISRFVVNMSFLIYPCDVAAWFTGSGLADAPTLLEAYSQMIDRVPELQDFATFLSGLTGSDEDRVHSLQAKIPLSPWLTIELFYNLIAQAKPSSAALTQLLKDPLNAWFADPDRREVIPVGAAGNGIRRFVGPGGTSAPVRLDFPFAPALWDSVVSVSASANGDRAFYSNSGEIMLDGNATINVAAGTEAIDGTSFSAPRLSTLEALYLIHHDNNSCAGSTPPMGYVNSSGGLNPLAWLNLPIGPATSARYCPPFPTSPPVP